MQPESLKKSPLSDQVGGSLPRGYGGVPKEFEVVRKRYWFEGLPTVYLRGFGGVPKGWGVYTRLRASGGGFVRAALIEDPGP